MIEVQSMFPVMVTPQLDAVKEFYETHFGFTTAFYEKEFYLHLVSSNGAVQLGFLMPGHPTQPDFLHPQMNPDGYVISLEVQDAEKAYDVAKSESLTISQPLKEEVWGQYHFMVTDPSGIQVDIVQNIDPQ
ncbi:VOC family protein [Parasalinivibrio latis]|uniref:VOC family protein n=1 Tax=Parasalinivibrio latis TaxID=2952610 RepID=UPI0030E2F0CB